MKTYEISHNGAVIADKVRVADSFVSRFRGLMLRKGLAEGEGLLLQNCGSIHCCFMRFTIDAVYLDADLSVIATETVRPWRLGKIYYGVKHVLELDKGKAADIAPGEKLECKEVRAE